MQVEVLVESTKSIMLILLEFQMLLTILTLCLSVLVNAADNKQRDPRMNTIKVTIDQ